MNFINGLAISFWVTPFDVILGIIFLGITWGFFYFWNLRMIYESAFGWIVWIGIYIILSVFLLGNTDLNTYGGLLPTWLAAFLVSTSIYLVFILAVIFPIHGSLVINIPTHPILYLVQFILVSLLFCFSIGAIFIYAIEWTYIFRVSTIFTYLRDIPYYTDVIRNSSYFQYVLENKDNILPLGVLLMFYKLLLSNIINAVLLSIWYNLSHIGFYKQSDNPSYRVEFHEVGWGDDGHDDHGGHWDDDWHDDHGWHWHGGHH